MTTGGELLVTCLEAQAVERIFCVPGESYLAVLDALYDSAIETVVARAEGGAAMMAEADGKLTGRPGIAFVTRGPGATNAASGVHVAQQDSTPMILFVGQIGRAMGGRDAFQEVDYRQTFGSLAKWVEQIDQVERIPEVISHAWHVAMNGRPGPVVLALPEDMLRETTIAVAGPRVEPTAAAPTPDQIAALHVRLAAAERPFVVVGGSRWDADATAALVRWAERWQLPVGASFRRQHLIDHLHSNYAGDVGLGMNPKLDERLRTSDLLILLGARFSENPSQNFTMLGIPDPGKALVHVHPGAEELGRIYAPEIAINATPGEFLRAALATLPETGPNTNKTGTEVSSAHADYLAWSGARPNSPGSLQMGDVIAHLNETLPADAIITNGAGNYATWVHRFYRFRGFNTQLAPVSGSMGYGLPAAVAAKLRYPDRSVICFAGDGCFQMTGFELGTALQTGAAVIVILVDNGMYGTIRMHQERNYPARVHATDLVNPDFVQLAEAYGAYAESVRHADEFPQAFERAVASGAAALLHLRLDPEAITPTTTLSAIRAS